MKTIIKLPEVKALTALSRSTIYRLIGRGQFPKQLKLAERSSGWIKQEVEEYIDKKINERL